MRLILLITFIFVLVAGVRAQKNISGNVSDLSTGEDIYHATVRLKGIGKETLTDISGNFKFKDLPSGIVRIQCFMTGFMPAEMIVNTDTLEQKFYIRLVRAEIFTEEIHVTDSSSVRPFQTEKLTSREIMRLGAMNISEALTVIPGVWQLSTGTGVSKPVIRGLYGNRIGIMVNGIRFDNQQWQDEHGLVMSSSGIDNVEVIKGPESLLFGPEAIGGVVSITDENPAPVGKEIADLNLKFFSNTLGILGDAGFKGSQDNFNWLLRFGGETHADYLDGNGDRIPETRFGGYTIKTSGSYMKGIWTGKINYGYTSYTYGILEAREFEKEIAKNETRFDRSFNGPHHLLRVHNFIFQNTFIKDRSQLRLNAGFINNNRKEQEGNDERFLPDSLQFGNLDMTLKTFSLDTRWLYSFARNAEINSSIQGFTQNNKNYGQRRLIPDADVNSLSASIFIKNKKNRFSFEGGARYDFFAVRTIEYGVPDSTGYFPAIDPVYNSVNGSAGITYRISEPLLLKANFSTGFRAPNLAELTSNGLHEGVFQYEIGNPDFKSEQGFETDAGVLLKAGNLSFELSAYVNNIKNYIYLGQTADTIQGYPVFRYFQSNAVLKGFEADLNYKLNEWIRLRANYSTVAGSRSDGANLPLIPPDKITALIHLEPEHWNFLYSPYIELSSYTSLAKTRLAENETGTPPYTLLNADLGFDLKFESQLINISLSCNNIFNKVYTDFRSRIKLINGTYDGKTFYANNMGLNVVMAVKIPFRLSYN